jgi:uncharacterized pyridoxal phosphate-containing UPF0001 family protein
MSHAARIAENLARVRDEIAEAAVAARRDPTEVRLVAVTKYVDAAIAAHLVTAGCTDLGESRPQELWDKAAAAELAGTRWHLIGRLQRNKVRRTLPLTALIHSVDSERLLAEIDAQAGALNLTPRVRRGAPARSPTGTVRPRASCRTDDDGAAGRRRRRGSPRVRIPSRLA